MPAYFDDWRNESASHNVAVVYRGDVDKFWVRLHAEPAFEGYATWGGEIAATDGDNWLLGVGGVDLKWGCGAEALCATLDDLFEQ